MRISVALIAATFFGSFLLHAADSAVYKVEFDVHSVAGAAAQPAQHFSMVLEPSRRGTFQAVTRVPSATGSDKFIDVGATIECTVQESNGKAILDARLDFSSITGYVNLAVLSEPIIGQRKAVIHTTLAFGTSTVVATTAPQVEATVTRLR